jgi:hypothetical protein
MANPLGAFKGLKTWQQVAIIGGGGAAVIGVVVYDKKAKAAKASAAEPAAVTAAAAGTTATAGEIEDPATGQYYPDDTVDPETGLTYQQEITEYGSVAAADTEGLADQGEQQDETPEEYEEEIGGTSSGTTGATVATNAQWMAEVESGLSQQGYTASDIGQGIAGYFAGKPLGTSADGTNLYTMMNLAVSEYGPAPVGDYPLLNGGGTSSLPGTGSPPPATGTTPGDQGSTEAKAPSAPKASGNLVNGADLTWGTASGAQSYVLTVQGAGGKGTGTSKITNRAVSGTSTHVDLTPGRYQARVRASGSAHNAWSAWTPFTVTK